MNRLTMAVLGVFCVTLAPAVYYGVKQQRENALLDAYLRAAGIDDTVEPWEAAKILSQSLRERFEVDESKFAALKMSERPFLREPSDYLLAINEGQCGEGARVLVNLMQAAGLDATRVSLYDTRLHSTHTLVSLVAGGQEYFVDSINTTEEMNTFLNTNRISAESFQIVKYDNDVTIRVADARTMRLAGVTNQTGSSTEERFFDRFRYYSYEALPLTKLLSAVGLDTRMLNFERPPAIVSSLAEKPYAIMSIAWAGVSFTLTLLSAAAAIVTTRRRRSRRF